LKINVCRISSMLAAALLTSTLAVAGEDGHSLLVLTSTNNASGNDVVVFKLNVAETPSLAMADMLPTGGTGGASNNAGILQFEDDLGAVANYGSSNVTSWCGTAISSALGPQSS
jgi:hypothetical protein